jgi:hypothetical protein
VVRHAARSAAVGFAVPMSMPRYTCIESIEISSTSPSCSATAIATADLPDAVGPTTATNGSAGHRRSQRGDGDPDLVGRFGHQLDEAAVEVVRGAAVISTSA